MLPLPPPLPLDARGPEPAPSSTNGPTSLRGVSGPSAPGRSGRWARGGVFAGGLASAWVEVMAVVVGFWDGARMGRGRVVVVVVVERDGSGVDGLKVALLVELRVESSLLG